MYPFTITVLLILAPLTISDQKQSLKQLKGKYDVFLANQSQAQRFYSAPSTTKVPGFQNNVQSAQVQNPQFALFSGQDSQGVDPQGGQKKMDSPSLGQGRPMIGSSSSVIGSQVVSLKEIMNRYQNQTLSGGKGGPIEGAGNGAGAMVIPGAKVGEETLDQSPNFQMYANTRYLNYLRLMYGSLMEEESSNDNAVFALPADPASVENERHFVFNLSFVNHTMSEVQSAYLHLFRKRLNNGRAFSTNRKMAMVVFFVSLRSQGGFDQRSCADPAQRCSRMGAGGRTRNDLSMNPMEIPDMYRLYTLPLDQANFGWNLLNFTGVVARALRLAQTTNSTKFFIALRFEKFVKSLVHEVELRNFVGNNVAKPFLVLNLKPVSSNLSVMQLGGQHLPISEMPTKLMKHALRTNDLDPTAAGSDPNLGEWQQDRPGGDKQAQPNAGVQGQAQGSGSSSMSMQSTPQLLTGNAYSPFRLLEANDAAFGNTIIEVLRGEIESRLMSDAAASNVSGTGTEGQNPMDTEPLTPALVAAAAAAAANSSANMGNTKFTMGSKCGVRPWKLNVPKALSNVILYPPVLEINTCSGHCVTGPDLEDMRNALIYKAYWELNEDASKASGRLGGARRGQGRFVQDWRGKGSNGPQARTRKLRSMCVPDKLGPLELVLANTQPRPVISRLMVPNLVVQSCKCVYGF